MDEIFMFVTSDIQLKMIFINTYASGGIGALIQALFSKDNSQKIYDVINANQGSKRVKPDFGINQKEYFRQLIEQEKQLVMESMGDRGHFNYQ